MTERPPPTGGQPLRAIIKILLIVCVIAAANYIIGRLAPYLDLDIRPSNEALVHRIVMIAAATYVLALAIPFVPGVEIGLGLMMVLGVGIVPLVYGCTVGGLTLAFLMGRLLPAATLIRMCHDLHLTRVGALLTRFDAVPAQEKLAFLSSHATNRATRLLLRNRYVALAVIINLPGNFIVGGGGGVAMLAGCSRLFNLPLFLLTILVAVAPVPAAMLLFGTTILER